MAKKNNDIPGVTLEGDITVNGPMFDIHDNTHVHITYPGKVNQESDDDFEYVNLVFFDKKWFGTYERQLALRKILKEAFKRMLLDTGRDLVAVYIAYHFLKDQLLNLKGYTDFLQDLEGLMPGMLPKIKEDETTRALRYKSYAESLALECEKWFIENGCLPDKRVWKSHEYKYNVDNERRNRIQKLVTDIYQGMKDITR
jgi:hypothetical protein